MEVRSDPPMGLVLACRAIEERRAKALDAVIDSAPCASGFGTRTVDSTILRRSAPRVRRGRRHPTVLDRIGLAHRHLV